jgi:DNA replication protein DnaC
LYLFSNTNGTRKSSFAAAILRARWLLYPNENCGGYFQYVTVDMLRNACMDFGGSGREQLAAWRETPILVLDDVGATRNTPHVVDEMCRLVMARYDAVLPLIMTANPNLQGLGEFLDPRVASRMQEGGVVDMGSTDWRRP